LGHRDCVHEYYRLADLCNLFNKSVYASVSLIAQERTQYENSSLVNLVRDQLATCDIGAHSLPAYLVAFIAVPIAWHRGHQRI
jgi:hypothetical protein